jgi:transglutaminase-like putative cysteine protease
LVLLFAIILSAPAFAAVSSADSEVAEEFTSYYDQLDANGKEIYDRLKDASADGAPITVNLPMEITVRSDVQEGAETTIRNMIRDTVDEAFIALRLSSPLSYWGWGASSINYIPDMVTQGNSVTVSSIYFEIDLEGYPKDPETGEFQGIQKMLDDLNEAIAGFSTASTSVRDKIMDINNYLTGLITYDPNLGTENESRYAHDAYGALVDPNHYAVCDGYSKAFLLLCQKEGIECVVVFGTGLPSFINHAWNYVKLDNGSWYAIDVTWNDSGGNAYFLIGGDAFFTTHQQGVFLEASLLPYKFNSPPISKTSYDSAPQDSYAEYAWLLAILLVAIILMALYKHSKGQS